MRKYQKLMIKYSGALKSMIIYYTNNLGCLLRIVKNANYIYNIWLRENWVF